MNKFLAPLKAIGFPKFTIYRYLPNQQILYRGYQVMTLTSKSVTIRSGNKYCTFKTVYDLLEFFKSVQPYKLK